MDDDALGVGAGPARDGDVEGEALMRRDDPAALARGAEAERRPRRTGEDGGHPPRLAGDPAVPDRVHWDPGHGVTLPHGLWFAGDFTIDADVLEGEPNTIELDDVSLLAHADVDRAWLGERLDLDLTANWRLIRTLDPLFGRSDAASVIFVTSGMARSARAYWAPYSVSKAALEALAKTYANETADTQIKVNLVDPGGALATRMRAEAYPGEDQATLPRPEQMTEIIVELAMAENTLTGQLFTPKA